MSEPLALKYRPRKFADLVGQPQVQVILYHQVRLGKIPTGLLFTGQRGTGKTTTARILGAALNCTNWERGTDKPVIPCGECDSCQAVKAGRSLDVLEIDAASNGGVAEIRKLKDEVRFGAPGEWRVVLLDEAHSMSPEAFNALLKVLEEPPPRTVFVLVTTEPGRIMPTVASRCHRHTFTRIPPAVIAKRLRWICEQEGLIAADDLLDAISRQCDGAMRDAIMLLEQVTSIGLATAADLAKLHGQRDHGPQLLAACLTGNHAAVYAALDAVLAATGEYAEVSSALVDTLRDVLVLQAGGTIPVQGDELAARDELARTMTKHQAVAALKVLWDLRTRVRGISPRSSLELALAMVSDRFVPVSPPKPTNGNGNGHGGPLSVDVMRKLAGAQ